MRPLQHNWIVRQNVPLGYIVLGCGEGICQCCTQVRKVDKEVVRLVWGVVVSDIKDRDSATKHGFQIKLGQKRDVGIRERQDRSWTTLLTLGYLL
jgi:hypothetical protein